ncbi:MAG TPA: response regulator [Cyanobacteria bacterium UBA11049]|nr:response regulator [Cyanobacteria bacterium UBA11049]
MMVEPLATNDFVSQFTALKQNRFSGEFLLKGSAGQEWIIYLFLGRILYATGGNHPVRRWLRQLKLHCPQIDLHQLKLSAILSNSSSTTENCWECQLLYAGVEQQQITREQAGKMIGAIVAEVLFDVTQAIHVNHYIKPENSTLPQLVLLDPGQLVAEVQQVWQSWQTAKIADRSPNKALVINHPEQLQQQVSPAVYQNLTKLLDGQRTLRDLALVMNRDVKDVTCSLLPYIQAGLVELIDIPDLAPPIAPKPTAAPPTTTTTAAKGPVIACVDDSPLVCQSLEQILTSNGYQFIAIQDSLRAMAGLLTRKPDLIFLDLVMPNTNGYEICSQLRKVSAFRTTPIIILTGNDGIIDRVRAKIVGASDFLSKPVDAEIVLSITSKHLNSNVSMES